MSKRRNPKAAEENRRRFEAHAHEKGAATRAANRQQLVALGKQGLEHLHPVPLPLLEHDLDRVDPRLPSGMRPAHNGEAAPFIPPKFQPSLVREIKPMSPAAYVQSQPDHAAKG